MARVSVAVAVGILVVWAAVAIRAIIDGDYTGLVAVMPIALFAAGFMLGGRAVDEFLTVRRELRDRDRDRDRLQRRRR